MEEARFYWSHLQLCSHMQAELLRWCEGHKRIWCMVNVLPVSSLGLRLGDVSERMRVAVGFTPGTAICGPHSCHHCGSDVDVFGRHALSCRWSIGRHHRHADMNDIIGTPLTFARIPSRLGPTGLLRTDRKRLDGMSLAP